MIAVLCCGLVGRAGTAAVASIELSKWVQLHEAQAGRFPDGNVATVWGAIRLAIQAFRGDLPAFVEFHPVGLTSRGLAAGLRLQRSGVKVRRAPLVIFLTGLYGEIADPVAAVTMKELHVAGNHVVGLPNPWSREYRNSKPRSLPGNFVEEAKVVLRVLPQAVALVGESSISSVSVAGVSYGAFLSAIVAVLDSRSAQPLIGGSITLFSPPLDFARALERMDRGVAGLDGRREECGSAGRHWATQLNLMMARSMEDLWAASVQCANYQLFSVFEDELRATFESRGSSSRAGAEGRAPRVRRFAAFIDEFMPEVRAHHASEGVLRKWLERLPADRRARTRIIAARDDFLVTADEWSGVLAPGLLGAGAVTLLSWGGHFGYGGLPSFMPLMQALF